TAQAKFLSNLGYQWIAACGEDGNGTGKPYFADNQTNARNLLQSVFEWVRAGQLYPKMLRGYACCHYDPFNICSQPSGNNGSGYCVGFTDPVLMFLLKYPYVASTYLPDTKCTYYSGVLAGVNAKQVRSAKEFIFGKQYTIGMGLQQIGNGTGIDAKWNADFSEYTLIGRSDGDIWGNSDNLTYAFTQQNLDFEVQAQIKDRTNTAKAGIMVRQEMTPGSPRIYLHYNSIYSALALHHRSKENSNTIQDTSITNIAPVTAIKLKIQRRGSTVFAFYCLDGSNWASFGQVSFKNGPVFVGLANSLTNGVTGNVVYSNVKL
ncbi:MAG: hypothetical protein PHC61_04900, partial [Chitinivibrionales bacterium]|nr:hypothetical protein [Chitinivibrionales bacterium]